MGGILEFCQFPESSSGDLTIQKALHIIEDGIVRVKLSTSVDDIRADEEVTCEVFTIGGAQVGRFTCARKDIRRTLKQSGAAPGTYMVKTIQDSSTTTEKISIDY